MPEFLYDIPLLLSGFLIIAAVSIFAITGLMLVRRKILPHLDIHLEDGDFTGAMMQSVMMFYGLAVALIAVSVWQTYADTQKIISNEASAIAVLYRNVSTYPEPQRTQLQTTLKNYTRYVIDEAWPVQRQGLVPYGGISHMNKLQTQFASIEPETEAEKARHIIALGVFNQLLESRRLRLDAVHTRVPGIMWGVVIIGALIGLTTSFFFRVADVRLHYALVGLLAAFIGLVMFMILAFDRPFRGDLGLSPESYQLVYDQLMTTKL
jgi:hypothetical protein